MHRLASGFHSTLAPLSVGLWPTPLRSLLALTLALAMLGCGESRDDAPTADGRVASRSGAEKPLNVLIITLDTTRADALGVYGEALDTSPNIDRFAASGVVFDQAATAQPSTLPSHSTIMTGRLPFSHGARANAGYVLAEDNETLAEVFQRHGYVTGAEIAAPVIGSRTLLDQGFATYHDTDSFDVKLKSIWIKEEEGPREVELKERDGADITRRGIEFLRRHKEAPFFLWLHYFDPHAFYAAPPPFGKKFVDDPYYSEIYYTDFNVGRVLTELQRQGLSDDTLVVITADHGESRGEHKEVSHSYFIYDATIHVPLIFIGPGVFEGGSRVRTPVRTADIAPTVLEFAGLPPLQKIQGVSLAGLIRGEVSEVQLDLYAESFEPISMFGTNVLRFLRRGPWKYVHKLRPELFDISSDPDELRNVFDQHPARGAEMRRDLEAWLRRDTIVRDGNRVQLDAESLAQLNALGYVGEGAPSSFDEAADFVALHEPDPADRIDDVLLNAHAWGKMKAGLFDLAAEDFAELLERNPESLPILRGALAAIRDEDPVEQARLRLSIIDRLIALEPENPHHMINRSDALAALGRDPSEVEDAVRGALVVEPCSVPARIVLANVFNEQSRYLEQRDLLSEGIEECDDEINARNDLAYLLATAPDPAVRDGKRALELAQQVIQETPDQRPDFIDTLACAWAELGDFERAVRESKRAIELLSQRDVPEAMVAPYREHLASFEKSEAVRAGGGL